MKKKNRRNRTGFAGGLLILIMVMIWALAISDGGLGILAHWGIRSEKYHIVTALCTDVDITYRFNMLRGDRYRKEKSYTFFLEHGQSYRINTTASALSEIGLTEEALNALEGEVLTVEYVNSPFSLYPLISLGTGKDILIPGDISVQKWEAIWSSAHLCLAFFGGVGILILLCDNLPPLIRSVKKKRRLRRKKLRRQQQLEQKSRKEP
jgi:hypothetical protein